MKEVLLLSKFFFKDLIHRKIFFVALGLGIVFILLSLLLGPLSYSEESRLAINFSLSGTQIALIFLSVLVGADFIKSDVESQSIHAFLVRPLSRFQYYFSKFLAFTWCLSLLTAVMWLCFFITSLLIGIEDSLWSFLPYLGIFVEALILFSFSLLISLFASSLLAVGASFTLFLVGHWVEVFKFLSEKSESAFVKFFGAVVTKGFPNLETLNWKAHLTYGEWMAASSYLKFSFYGLCWSLVLLFVGYFIFAKKDFA